MTPDVIIVGAGIAGLSTAYELYKHGVSFLLVDRSSRAGGVILSEEVDGFTIDAGPDALLIQKPDGIRLCEELGLASRLVATKLPRLAYVQRGGRLHPLPPASVFGIPTGVGPFVRTRLFSWPGKMRLAAELLVPARRDDRDESIGAFMRRRFGHEATVYLAEPLLAGIYAGDVDRLSVRALFPRFVEAERNHGSLLKAFRQTSAPPASPAGAAGLRSDGPFKSLPGGLSEMVRALVATLPPNTIRLEMPIARLTRSVPSGLLSVASATGEILEARAIILATPAHVTSLLVRDLDGDLSRLCGEINYSSVATIVLAFRRDAVTHPLNGSGFVVPRVEGSSILAASWLSSKWPHRAPEGRVLLRTFVGGTRDPRALERSDEDLVQQSLVALTPLLGLRGAPLLRRVYRWDRANAQHEVGHLDRIAAINRVVARHPGLFVAGSGFQGIGIPDCIATGRSIATEAAEWVRESTGNQAIGDRQVVRRSGDR